MEEVLARSLRRAVKISPAGADILQQDDYTGPRDKEGRPHGKGTMTYNDGSLTYLGAAFSDDVDGLENGKYEGFFVHGKVGGHLQS